MEGDASRREEPTEKQPDETGCLLEVQNYSSGGDDCAGEKAIDAELKPADDKKEETDSSLPAEAPAGDNVEAEDSAPRTEQEEEEDKEADVPGAKPEPVETEDERLIRIKDFYNTEFSRPDLEQHGSSKTTYMIIRYDNYQRPSDHNSSAQANKRKSELDEGNAKIAEYFGEDLNSDEEFDQLIKQFSEATNINEGGTESLGGDKENHLEQSGTEGKLKHAQPKSFIPATIPEEKENEVLDSSLTKQKAKDKKKKNFDITSTKVHIRHLPKNMRKEDLLEALGPLPEYNYLHFTSGQFMSRVCNRRCTGFCHINFVNQEDADAFVSNYRLFIIRDERGEETLGSVEYSINQRFPKTMFTGVLPAPLYDMQKDQNFVDFKSNYYENTCGGIIGVPVNPDGSVTADVMINEIEERRNQKNELQTTPLLSYIIAQAKNEKEKKFGNALKKASEKSRITIKKERKRDRRDRRDRKEKEKEKEKTKILRTTVDDKAAEVKEIKQSDNKKAKAARGERPEKVEHGKNRRSDQGRGKESENRNKSDAVDKKLTVSTASKETDGRKDKTSPGKKAEKKPDKRQSGGGTANSNRTPKPDSAPPASASSVSKTSDTPKKADESTATTKAGRAADAPKNPEASATSAAASEQEKSQVKKKTIKRIVKVKKVVKSKADDGGNSTIIVTEKKEDNGSKGQGDDSQVKATGSSDKTECSSAKGDSGSSSGGGNGSKEAQPGTTNSSESKRTRKARPDMQIYRPGSLRSSKASDGSGSKTSDSSTKKEKTTSQATSSKNGGNKEKATADESSGRKGS